MELKDCKVDGSEKVDLKDMRTNSGLDKSQKQAYIEKTDLNREKIALLQEKLYAESKEGVIIIFQAMDAAGKDGTIKHVMTSVNPQGVTVSSFKQPSKEELAHDYLWRACEELPERGEMAIFNRSYYEDVLVVDVHDLQKGYSMPKRCIDDKDFFEKRYAQIRNFEEYLYENGFRILKLFLHVSKDEQKERFIKRIDEERKNWKFSSADLAERAFWDDYQKVYADVINATATKHNPWYVIPANQKWFMRYLTSEAVLGTLEACHSEFPELSKEEEGKLAEYREALLSEDK